MAERPPENLRPVVALPTPEWIAVNTVATLLDAYHGDGAKLLDCAAQAQRLWDFVAPAQPVPPH